MEVSKLGPAQILGIKSQQALSDDIGLVNAALADVWRRQGDNLDAWPPLAVEANALITAGKARTVARSEKYVATSMLVQGASRETVASLVPSSFVDISLRTGLPLLYHLLKSVPIAVKTAIANGNDFEQAKQSGWQTLSRIASNEVASANVQSTQAVIASTPSCGGYGRVLHPGACARCVILVDMDKWDFPRHPGCRCGIAPIAGEWGDNEEWAEHAFGPRYSSYSYFNALSREEQDRIFTKGGAQAIRDGANMWDVVNARRSARTKDGMRITYESTTRHGAFAHFRERNSHYWHMCERVYGKSRMRDFVKAGGRLLPEEIYKHARTREEALQGLWENGYLRVPNDKWGPDNKKPWLIDPPDWLE
ncbi:hypothetical protein [Actinobaculum suis]|uniref:hypothetical protein n=1 Tax=Actinobaculum suis TaxID=1657 RepID=UPI00163B62B0|nr:hypothetical protein [Actinobaculum suis]